jgi:hypothetical protein
MAIAAGIKASNSRLVIMYLSLSKPNSAYVLDLTSFILRPKDEPQAKKKHASTLEKMC